MASNQASTRGRKSQADAWEAAGIDSTESRFLLTSAVNSSGFGEISRIAEVADVEGDQSSKKHSTLTHFSV